MRAGTLRGNKIDQIDIGYINTLVIKYFNLRQNEL